MPTDPQHDQRFKGKHIVITGAGGNFGREGCLFFASRGSKITALDLNEDALEETKRQVQAISQDVICISCNVCVPDDVEASIRKASETFGTPDLLWNNAGYQGEIKTTLDYSIEDFSRVMNINVTGMFTVLQSVSKRMAEAYSHDNSKRFAIVQTASVAGLRGTPAMVAYSASKAAVIAMTVSCSKDLAPHGIRVNAISPALIGPGYMWDRQNELHASSGSPYFDRDPNTVAKNKIDSVPMKRLGTTEEVIKSVAFLLSEDSSYTNGFNLVIDGGLSSGMK